MKIISKELKDYICGTGSIVSLTISIVFTVLSSLALFDMISGKADAEVARIYELVTAKKPSVEILY